VRPANTDPDALVFTAPEGGPVRHELFRRRVFNPARSALPAAKAKLTWHDLRHTCASLLIDKGANVLLVARHLGHADPSMTLRVYGHLYPSHEAALADALDAGITEAEHATSLRAA
jgi:integrase